MFVEQYRTFPDDQNLGWKCEYWGKMMRGSVFTYEYTKDEVLYDTLVETVLDMLSAQQPDRTFHNLQRGQGIRRLGSLGTQVHPFGL